MAKVGKPRSGSMQYWPRRKAKREYPRVISWAQAKDAKLLGFAGYKAGMTHVIFTNNNKNATTKKMDISVPVTIIECPPMKVAAIRFYKKVLIGKKALGEVFAPKLDKELSKRTNHNSSKKFEDFKEFDEIKLLVYTQPKLTGIGKKKPELFEMAIGGSKDDQIAFAQEKLGKDITIQDVFQGGEQVDIHAVTKGKGFQGPVKRFGVALRSHKSEKVIRGPGSLGGWKGHAHFMYRIAHAGQMGYHTRTEHNKWVLKVGENPEEVNINGGVPHYGLLKNNYILVKGSVAGPQKRLIRFNVATRPKKNVPTEAPKLKYIAK